MNIKRHLLIFDNNNRVLDLLKHINLENYQVCSIFVPISQRMIVEGIKSNIAEIKIDFSLLIEPADEATICLIFQSLERNIGNIDILINIDEARSENFLHLSEKEWDDSFFYNLTSPFLIIREYVKLIKKTKGNGKIIVFNSLSSMMPSPDLIAYSSFRAGLEFLTKLISIELCELSISVNSIIIPNELELKINQAINKNLVSSELYRDEEVAEVVNYLLNVNKNGVVGHSFVIDSGVSLY